MKTTSYGFDMYQKSPTEFRAERWARNSIAFKVLKIALYPIFFVLFMLTANDKSAVSVLLALSVPFISSTMFV